MTFVNWYRHLWKLSTLQIKKVQLPQNTMHATLWNPHTTPKLFRFPLIVLFVCLFVFCGFEKKHQKQLAKVFYLFYLDKLNWSKSSKQQIKTKRQPFLPFFSRKLITTMNANASAKNFLSPIAVIINICKKTHAHNFIFTLKLTPNLFSSFFYLFLSTQASTTTTRKRKKKNAKISTLRRLCQSVLWIYTTFCLVEFSLFFRLSLHRFLLFFVFSFVYLHRLLTELLRKKRRKKFANGKIPLSMLILVVSLLVYDSKVFYGLNG